MRAAPVSPPDVVFLDGKFVTLDRKRAISVENALRMWTIRGARSLGLETDRGSIEAGKLADMTVLSEDILTIPPAKIDEIRAEQTVVGGEVVYRIQ